MIHPLCAGLVREFEGNRYFIAKQSRIERLYNDCGYLEAIRATIGQPELYYAYGIPIYRRFGNLNWFHLSNVLPIAIDGVPVSFADKLKLGILGRRICRSLGNTDVISAESDYSLGLLRVHGAKRLFLSVNGSDDEMEYIRTNSSAKKKGIATVVGTKPYKALLDSFRVFEMLKKSDEQLELMIIGAAKDIPRALRSDRRVIVRGLLSRADVISCLRESKYYISTTLIENSYNAASEGIFIADQSYISGIGPHRELLLNERFVEVPNSGIGKPLLHVVRAELRGLNLKSWNAVIGEMIEEARDVGRNV